MDESWMDELRDLEGVLRPTAEALPTVQEQVRRRRRVRAFGGALGAAGLVAAVTAAAVLIPNHGGGPGSVGPVATTPTETPSPTPVPGKVSPNFDCGHGAGRIDIFTTAPPPIVDLVTQKALIEELMGKSWSAFELADAEPTQLGVVALVTGDYQDAKATLQSEGVRQIAVQTKALGSAHDQAMNFIQELLEPALDEVNRRSKSVPGHGSTAVWSEGGAVVVDWKAPIPDEIKAMAGVRPDGVRVIVQPVRYSENDIQVATNRVLDAIKSDEVDAKWSSATGCDDGSGMVLGIQPDSLGKRTAALETQLTEIAGMPVHVIAEEAPVPL
jgi:hypothetical protein